MTQKNDIVEKPRRFQFFVLSMCLPLAIGLYFFILPDYSPFSPDKLETLLVGYSATLLGYFSGIRLGTRLNIDDDNSIWILPLLSGPIFGLLVMTLPFSLALALLVVGFGAHGAWDVWSGFKGEFPDKYSAMRRASTWVICLLLIVVLILDGMAKSAI